MSIFFHPFLHCEHLQLQVFHSSWPSASAPANALCESVCNNGVASIAIIQEVVLRPDPRLHNIRLVRLGIFVFCVRAHLSTAQPYKSTAPTLHL